LGHLNGKQRDALAMTNMEKEQKRIDKK